MIKVSSLSKFNLHMAEVDSFHFSGPMSILLQGTATMGELSLRFLLFSPSLIPEIFYDIFLKTVVCIPV